jgi:hypothetical protein
MRQLYKICNNLYGRGVSAFHAGVRRKEGHEERINIEISIE